ncbi:MAG TPA: GH116 family glycosyl hydrolase, partial [Bacillota bacterium]|nr:GH116 family glycosyl hydrolase [Bacillota bacterium]
QGLEKEAAEIGFSLYNTIWNTGELWFRTPEAWCTGISNIRGYYYMRATTVWALKHAYDITSGVSKVE